MGASTGSKTDQVLSVEINGKNEGFCTSSIRSVDGGKANRGVLLDGDFNAILCAKVLYTYPAFLGRSLSVLLILASRFANPMR